MDTTHLFIHLIKFLMMSKVVIFPLFLQGKLSELFFITFCLIEPVFSIPSYLFRSVYWWFPSWATRFCLSFPFFIATIGDINVHKKTFLAQLIQTSILLIYWQPWRFIKLNFPLDFISHMKWYAWIFWYKLRVN